MIATTSRLGNFLVVRHVTRAAKAATSLCKAAPCKDGFVGQSFIVEAL